MTAYSHQISAPANMYYSPEYPPARGPSHTLPLYMNMSREVPDDVITGATLPRTHQYQQVYEQGVRDERHSTLDGQTLNLAVRGPVMGGMSMMDNREFDDLLYPNKESIKEREVLKQNRARLTEYIHDCTLLFPYMREKNVFNRTDCDKINHEITSTLKMDTFIDIVLTKGPNAIGVFHEALDYHYPAVFDVLSGLFTNAGINLSANRRKKERPELDEESLRQNHDDSVTMSINNRGLRGREGIRTIRIRLKELSKHCEKVQTQRDKLQSTLQMREQDIDALISRIGLQDAQNSDLMNKLKHWREAFADQSNGSIEQLGEIIQEKEIIQKEYTELAGELELTVSELMAARDRIGKLLLHLDRTDKQAAATVEANDKLQEKVQMQNGEIQKLQRKIDRLKSDDPSSPVSDRVPTDKRIEELEEEVAKLNDECELLREQTRVASRERKLALEEKDQAVSKLHTEKTKNGRLKVKVKDLQSQVNDASSQNSAVLTPDPLPLGLTTPTRHHVEDSTVFMTTEHSGLELGLAVVVRGVSEGSKAFQEGLRVGDEIREVNRVQVTSDTCKDPLEFARQIISSVSTQIVTLTIRRQTTPTSVLQGLLDVRLRGKERKLSSHSPIGQFSKQLKYTGQSAKSSSTSTRSHDTTSGDDTQDSVSLTDQSESDDIGIHGNRVSQVTTASELTESGVIGSPRNSLGRWDLDCRHGQQTLHGKEFGGPGMLSHDSILKDENSGPVSLPATPPANQLKRKNVVRKSREKMKLSKSLDDMNRVKLPTRSPVLDEVSMELRSHIRQVIVRHGHWGEEFSFIGGRGNGVFVQSNCTIRGLNTGDQILQIGDHPTKFLSHAEVLEMISGFSDSYYFMLVAENRAGYEQLVVSDSSRDNFYVRARYSHHSRNRSDCVLDYMKGDVFHVLDTKPQEYHGFWQVEKVKRSSGEAIMGGYVPTMLQPHEMMEGTSSLPVRGAQSPNIFQRRPSPSTPTSYRPPPAKQAYELYQPIREVTITMPRPLVLLGACEGEVQKGLVEQGIIEGLKFAFCVREPAEKLEQVSHDLIVETVVTEGEVFKSTVDHVIGAANQGYHCVLCLRHDELLKPGVASLHPIVLILTPRKGFKAFRDPPTVQRRSHVDISYSNWLKRKYDDHISGEVALSVGMCLDDALRVVRETVARKQGEVVWEPDV